MENKYKFIIVLLIMIVCINLLLVVHSLDSNTRAIENRGFETGYEQAKIDYNYDDNYCLLVVHKINPDNYVIYDYIGDRNECPPDASYKNFFDEEIFIDLTKINQSLIKR